MKTMSRSIAALLLVMATAFGTMGLVACGGSSSASASALVSSASAAASEAAGDSSNSSDSADSDDQADCYGDDLPAVKSK